MMPFVCAPSSAALTTAASLCNSQAVTVQTATAPPLPCPTNLFSIHGLLALPASSISLRKRLFFQCPTGQDLMIFSLLALPNYKK